MACGVLAALVVFYRHQLVAGYGESYVCQRQRTRDVSHEGERCATVAGGQCGVGDVAHGLCTFRIARV